MKNTTEACLAAGGVKPPKSGKRLCPHGVAPANIVTVINYDETIKRYGFPSDYDDHRANEGENELDEVKKISIRKVLLVN